MFNTEHGGTRNYQPTGVVPPCLAQDPRPGHGRCSGNGGHDGRHININGSWWQDPAKCTDSWHRTGRSTAQVVAQSGCPGCGTNCRPVAE